MYKIQFTKFFTFIFIILVSSTFSNAQSEKATNQTFSLHVNLQPAQGEVITQNLKHEEAEAFNAPEYIADHLNKGVIRIFGRLKNAIEYKYYNFDSSKLEGNEDCNDYCEKITSLERVPYFGFAVNPMEDFSGVEIQNIIDGSSAANSPLQIGDVITSIESVETTNPCQLTQAVGDQMVDDWVEVNYTSNGKSKSTMILMGYRVKKNVTWVRCCDKNIVEDELVVNAPTGKLDLQIFPNPTAGITQFELGTSSVNETIVQLMNMNGQVLKEMKVFPIDGYWQDYLDLAKYADGVYVLHVTQDKATVSKRIVLQKK